MEKTKCVVYKINKITRSWEAFIKRQYRECLMQYLKKIELCPNSKYNYIRIICTYDQMSKNTMENEIENFP